LGAKVSNTQIITQSIVNIGPVLYARYSSDLKAAGKDTVLVKYANDTTFIYPYQIVVSSAYEF